jgi:hypothetical protein
MLDRKTDVDLGRPRLRCKNNIKMDVKEVGCKEVDWTHLAQGKVPCQVL